MFGIIEAITMLYKPFATFEKMKDSKIYYFGILIPFIVALQRVARKVTTAILIMKSWNIFAKKLA